MRFVNTPAKSPARSNTGPEDCFKLTLNSLEIIFASVVFPSPGGPNKST